jgi:NAD(P)-dependent dehydrogenase (short-subunit alcohol dehydrogenase family)
MPNRFAGRVAFITGGATGFGRAFAQALVREGAAVALADIDLEAATRTAGALDTPGTPAMPVACDVADEQSVGRAVDQVVERLGGIDVLINNAARHLKKYNQPFSSLTSEEIRGLFDVNVIGVINCSLACKEPLSRRVNGVIVNMSSAGGFMASTPYAVTKLTVRGLTIAFANEFSADGIRVNAIAPTLVGTESARAEYSDEEFDRSVATRQLVHRRGSLDDVTATMLFLCSDEASFITGETLRVTGGAALAI